MSITLLTDLFYTMYGLFSLQMSQVSDLVTKFNILDNAMQQTFPKVPPTLVVSLIFDKQANRSDLYTLEMNLKPGQDTDDIRERVIQRTGMSPAFYLKGTKMIVSHPLDLDFLKWINDQEGIVSIKGSKYSAGGSSDF